MNELIETLNNTSPARVVFYSIVFLTALNIVFYYTANAIVKVTKQTKNNSKN